MNDLLKAGTASAFITGLIEAGVPTGVDKGLQAVNIPLGLPGQLISEVPFHLAGGLMHFAYENSAHVKDGVVVLWVITAFCA